MTTMNLDITPDPEISVAQPSGDITHAAAADFQSRLVEALGATRALVLDFSRLGLLTSAGLRALLMLHRQAHGAGRTLVLAAVPAGVREVMEVTGFWEHFVHQPSVDAARAALAGRAP